MAANYSKNIKQNQNIHFISPDICIVFTILLVSWNCHMDEEPLMMSDKLSRYLTKFLFSISLKTNEDKKKIKQI
uniref:Uncharacterized protein n=1 Tax=Octopus bimaculoides TaxID=37653 RepID=A0A0L8G5F1_OCTBM